MNISLRRRSTSPEPPELESVDPRTGTSVALGFPLLGVAALVAWFGAGLPQPPLDVWTLFVLPLLCAVYGLFPLLLDRRMYSTFERPTLVLTGLVGGPLAGVLAGVATGLGDVEAVWRRRSAFAGLAMLQGFAAGALGAAWQAGVLPLAPAVVLACLACLAIGAWGFAVVLSVRRCWSRARLVRAIGLDGVELLLAAPLLVLLAGSFHTSPAVTSLAAASALALVGFGVWALTDERSRLAKEREAQLTDRLTGAVSRAGFEDVLVREQARVLRGERPAGILVCDLDHFGLFNELYGHLGGDQALRHVVARINGAVRPMDVVARWGGDEICVLAPRLGTLQETERLAERIRAAVGSSLVDVGDTGARATVSIGGTLLTGRVTPEQAFARADEALYVAKRDRDAICVLPAESGPDLAPLGMEDLTPARG
jgi:diguanylate cyclase (GGDEF)-like protein